MEIVNILFKNRQKIEIIIPLIGRPEKLNNKEERLLIISMIGQ